LDFNFRSLSEPRNPRQLEHHDTERFHSFPIAQECGVYILQLRRNAQACSLYLDFFLQRYRLLMTKLLSQEFLKNHPILSFKKFFGRYQHLIIQL
jgi:hypothetical protein